VNCEWQEAENWYKGRLTIKPQTFSGLKEIELKTINIQQKKPTVCKNYAIKNTNKCYSSQTNCPAESTKNWCVDG